MHQLFYLTKEEIGFQIDDTVDGIHPTDLGMMKYGMSYEKKIRSILEEPTGTASTTHPITQYREPGNYDWEKRHREIMSINQMDPPKAVFWPIQLFIFGEGYPRLN